MTTRTQDEIVARIEASEDFFGFAREVLVAALDFEHAKPYLKDGVTAEEWQPEQNPTGAGREYLTFAIGKAVNHRGISASRSVEKLREYAWLAGRDDVVSAMDSASYEQYGVPKLKAFADGMGFEWPTDAGGDLDGDDVRMLGRMAEGLPCEDGCECGCGR